MAYVVNLTARAEHDLEYLYGATNAESSGAALAWYLGLTEAILNLEASPNRCPVAPENSRLRHLLYGNKAHICRVIYRAAEKGRRVDVLHIRHGARRRFKQSDIE